MAPSLCQAFDSLFFRKNNGYHEGGNGDLSNKEETQLEDQEELEGGER